MSVKTEEKQINEIINAICAALLQMVAAKGDQAAEFRRLVGLVHVNGLQYLADGTFGTNLYNCFVAVRTLPITVDLVAFVRVQISELSPTTLISIMVYDTAIQFCLTTECLFITQMTFASSDDVKVMMTRMTKAFDLARDNAAERMDSGTYQNLSYLAGSIVNHLNSVALKLPSLVSFSFNINRPSLTLANLIYQDANRADELVNENKVVHPAFMPRDIIGLNR